MTRIVKIPCSIFKTKRSTELKTGQQICAQKWLLPNEGKNLKFLILVIFFFLGHVKTKNIDKFVLVFVSRKEGQTTRRPFYFNITGNRPISDLIFLRRCIKFNPPIRVRLVLIKLWGTPSNRRLNFNRGLAYLTGISAYRGFEQPDQETMRWENTSPIHEPLPIIIFFNLNLALRGYFRKDA